MSDAEFLEFCIQHEDLQLECNARGEIEIMPPPGPETGDRNAEITFQLRAWAKKDGRGRSFDSSAMFVLPNGARRSPDSSWISTERIQALPKSQKGKLWHLCPEFVIELRSPSDRTPRLNAKMLEWIENGAQLGWLIDPADRTVTLYRAGQPPELLEPPSALAAQEPVAGFVLDLAEIWAELL